MNMYENIVAVTNRHLCSRPLPEQVRKICQLHPVAVVLREKDLSEEEYEQLAREIIPICQEYDVPLNLHFYPEVAKKLGVRRIHLPLWKLEEMVTSASTGQNKPEVEKKSFQTDIEEGKEETEFPGAGLDDFDVVGTSVHSVEDALKAQALGATYMTAGHIFTTDCKKGLPARGLEFLTNVCKSVSIPVYAIGGINREEDKIEAVLKCGAAAACVMSGMMGELLPDNR